MALITARVPRLPGVRVVLVLTALLVARAMPAQTTPTPGAFPADGTCDYRRCALTIAPRWNGLAVVAGDGGPTVANLHFLLPRDITASLTGSDSRGAIGADSAAVYARRALRLRRAGAALTDAGLVLGVVAALHASQGQRNAGRTTALAAAGGAALAVSIPLQFAADGALSRAVWWHNLRYAR